MASLKRDLKRVLDCHNRGDVSKTSTRYLARFLMRCLTAYEQTIATRDEIDDDTIENWPVSVEGLDLKNWPIRIENEGEE